MASLVTKVFESFPWRRRGPQDAAGGETSTSNGNRSWEDDLELTLSALVKTQDSRALGAVQTVSLTDFKESIGDLWDQYHKQILMIADTTIHRMLAKGDVAIEQDEDTWLLIFAGADTETSERRAHEIASVIGEKLIGERFADSEADAPQQVAIDLSSALNEDGSLNRSAMQAAVANARATMAARKAADRARRVAAIANPTSTDEQSVPATDTESKIRLIYRPAWSAETQSVDTYVCRPITETGEPAMSGPPSPALDKNTLAICKAGLVVLKTMIENRVRAKFVLPLPITTVVGGRFEKIAEAIRHLPENHRLVQLRLEVTGLSAQTPVSALIAAKERLRPLARDVAFLIQPDQQMEGIKSVRSIWVGADYSLSGPHISASDEARSLKRLKVQATENPCYVLGLSTPNAIATALELGFQEIGGGAIGADLKARPTSTLALPTSTLMARVRPPEGSVDFSQDGSN